MTKQLWMWVVCASCMLLSGCVTKSPTGPIHLIDTMDAGKLGYSLVWSSDTALPKGGKMRLVAPAGELLVTVEESTNIVTAVQLRDGIIRWQRRVSTGRNHIIAIHHDEKYILLASENDAFQLDQQTGETRNSFTLAQGIVAAPLTAYQQLVGGGILGLVFAQDAGNGFLRWSYRMTDLIPFALVQQGGTIYVVDRKGVVAALTGSAGTVIWRRQPTDAFTSGPVVTEDTLYAPTIENKLHAMDRATGRDRWIYRSQNRLIDSPVVLGKDVFQSLSGSKLVSLNAQTGEVQWQVAGNYHSIIEMPKGLLLAERNRMVLVERSTGEVLMDMTSHPTQAAFKAGDDIVVVGIDGRVIRLKPAI